MGMFEDNMSLSTIIFCFFLCRKESLSNNELNSICPPYTQQFNGQTPLSQIIASGGPSKSVDSSSILFDSFCNKRRKQSTVVSSSSSSKRGVLPKSATAIMRSWLFQHIVNNEYFLMFKANYFCLFKGSPLSNRR